MKQNVLIINPASSGKLIRPTFQALGIVCDALFSAEHDPHHLLDLENQALYRYIYHSIDEVFSEKYGIKYDAVIAGSELGVEECDILSNRLQLHGNAPETTHKRRNKYDMQQALSNHSLNHIKSYKVTPADDIKAMIDTFSSDKYIIKPIDAAGSENVFLCENEKEIMDKLMVQSWGEKNCNGYINNAFILQEYVQGDEYALDFIIAQGMPALMSVCKYEKGIGLGNEFVYNGLKIIDPQQIDIQHLVEYAFLAIKALDVFHGAVHMELIESKHNKQPVMVELATRLHGGVAPALFRECYEPHLLHGLSDLVLCPDKKPENAIFKQHGYVYFHVSTNKGVFQGIPDDEIKKILRLKSVKGINLWVSKGDEYQETTDLFTCPAISWLSHPSEIQIKEDVNAIKIILSRYFL